MTIIIIILHTSTRKWSRKEYVIRIRNFIQFLQSSRKIDFRLGLARSRLNSAAIGSRLRLNPNPFRLLSISKSSSTCDFLSFLCFGGCSMKRSLGLNWSSARLSFLVGTWRRDWVQSFVLLKSVRMLPIWLMVRDFPEPQPHSRYWSSGSLAVRSPSRLACRKNQVILSTLSCVITCGNGSLSHLCHWVRTWIGLVHHGSNNVNVVLIVFD